MQNETMKPSRWFTWEFFIYYGIVTGVTIATVFECIKISSPTHPSYSQYAKLLSPGWLFNRQIDLSDHQFRSFRDGIPSLLALFTLFAAFNSRFGNVSRFVGTVIFLFLMHGFRAVEPVSLVAINYAIVKFIILKSSQKHHKLIVPFTWIYAILALCVLECKFPQWTWSGFLPRWNVVFKMSILRMISFNLDFKSHTTDNTFAFTFVSFFMYIFYPPLYLSGPILTFKDFLHQITLKHHHPKPKALLIYAARLVACALLLEIILHFFHVCAIKAASAWDHLTPLGFAGVAFFNLKIIWLKLLVIWRFARFFALLDGIDPPENMVRCMSNNYSTLKFWRSWHRSFNLWIIKYLYIPLGGRQTANWNIFPIFAFVALWHDFNPQLLAWGGLVPIFILPELLANWLTKHFKLHQLGPFRFICALAAALNIFLLMLGNLIGFSVGIQGAKIMLTQIIKTGGTKFILSVLVLFFSAAQIMFEIREEEFRQTGKYSSM
jgi:protein-cysteine N-palmitoyltransferase HHAT